MRAICHVCSVLVFALSIGSSSVSVAEIPAECEGTETFVDWGDGTTGYITAYSCLYINEDGSTVTRDYRYSIENYENTPVIVSDFGGPHKKVGYWEVMHVSDVYRDADGNVTYRLEQDRNITEYMAFFEHGGIGDRYLESSTSRDWAGALFSSIDRQANHSTSFDAEGNLSSSSQRNIYIGLFNDFAIRDEQWYGAFADGETYTHRQTVNGEVRLDETRHVAPPPAPQPENQPTQLNQWADGPG